MMRRALIVLAFLFGLGCKREPVVVVRVDTTVVVDSSALREQRILVSLAEQQMTRYAQIVARECPRPCTDQRRFLVGWTRRAFAGATPDSTPQ